MANKSAQKYQKRSKIPALLALGALLIVIGTVIAVLVLAGGNQTNDGSGRDQQTNVSSPTNVTNSAGNGAGGPVR